jgi:ABC-type Fe3+/spermidine/putrescine transport system ATPase subunit
VVFRVGGIIDLPYGTEMAVTQPYLTVAGQTAPGDGICIRGGAIGVRPEKLTLLEPGQESKGNRLDGTVVDTSYLGVLTQYTVEGAGGLRLLVSEQNVDRTTRSDTWRPGERVALTWKPDHGFVVGDSKSA